MNTLNTETAIAYVRSRNFEAGNGAVEIKWSVELTTCGIPSVHVLAIDANGYRQEWSVWAEPLAGGALYGEF